jgi:hypothetical protein
MEETNIGYNYFFSRLAEYKVYSQNTLCIRHDACNAHLTTRFRRTHLYLQYLQLSNVISLVPSYVLLADLAS